MVYFEVSKLKYIIQMPCFLMIIKMFFSINILMGKIILIVNFHIVECYYNCVHDIVGMSRMFFAQLDVH